MRTWQQAITAFTQYVGGVLGNVEHLATDDKTSLVAAINEVKSTVPVFADGYDPNADGVWSSGNLLHRLSSLDNPSTLLEADPDWGVTAPTLDGDAGDQTVTLGGVYARLRTVERFPVWPGSLVWASVDLSAISDLPGERSAYLTLTWYDDEDTLLAHSNAGILDLSIEGGISTAFFQGVEDVFPTATHVRPGVAIAYPGQGVAGEQYAVYGLQIAVIGPSLSRLYGLVDLEGRLRGNGLVVEPAAGSDAEGHHRYSVRDEDTWDEFAADSDVTATADGGTRARGTLDAPEAVELGDILRYLWWREGHDGAGYSVASVAYLQVDDVVSEGVVPTAFVVEQADADGVLQETLRIASDGTVTAGGETVATTVAVDAAIAAAISDLVGGAPGALDTLNELAAALGDDASFAASVTSALAGKVGTGDSRLTDARTPTSHASTHATAGSDPITPASIGAASAANLALRAPLGPWLSGGYYSARPVTIATSSSVLNLLTLLPVWVPASCTLDRIAVAVKGLASGSALRLGLYANDASTDRPSTLIVDGGTVASTSTGAKEVTISQAVSAGWLWIAVAAQGGTPSVEVVTCSLPPLDGGGPEYAQCGYYATGVSGSLPSTLSSIFRTGGVVRGSVRVA